MVQGTAALGPLCHCCGHEEGRMVGKERRALDGLWKGNMVMKRGWLCLGVKQFLAHCAGGAGHCKNRVFSRTIYGPAKCDSLIPFKERIVRTALRSCVSLGEPQFHLYLTLYPLFLLSLFHSQYPIHHLLWEHHIRLLGSKDS